VSSLKRNNDVVVGVAGVGVVVVVAVVVEVSSLWSRSCRLPAAARPCARSSRWCGRRSCIPAKVRLG